MAEFKAGDVVFHTHARKFYTVAEDYKIRGRFIRLTDDDGFYYKLIEYLILVKNDTPQNRLVIQLKYG
jgi:hypothetical protein